ncbi:hypothetical protein SDRG_02377 [Saprolegnia diclina VS20]|uniref:Phospholipid/glycerol acyltransferase domain-containing protein n=1 Tax=Saprolegnia diclina (strain VS20) TaxID=1156394 RepID=T0R2H5_SAPDV|nr:hypothetical protein SDRG_02377 [Saprolegnia diclina VS20]EQC40485.1 hypothetical protein SDRG_02377 [Saprolegnia diclina VS20]|eukprot:XP_008606184.1 hypothetical protein SDRG_02377 [Saprolegnia diclina VS20]
MAKPVDYASTWLYRVLYTSLYPLLVTWFDWTVQGHEHLPKDTSTKILFVGYHTTHNWDVLMMAMAIKDALGEPPVGLMHSAYVALSPWVSYLGGVEGTRANAADAYQRGHRACLVLPGGVEEAVAGFENAYTVNWKSASGRDRTGFAEVVLQAGGVIVPVVVQNAQEMCFSPVFFLSNVSGLSRVYDTLMTLPLGIGWFLWQLKQVLWLLFSFGSSIPLPVKATLKFGPPLQPLQHESAAAFAHRVASSYAAMLATEQPGGLNYTRALQARFGR